MDKADKEGYTPLLHAVCENAEVATLLLEKKADIGIKGMSWNHENEHLNKLLTPKEVAAKRQTCALEGG